MIGRQFSLIAKYVPPQGVASPVQWGEVSVVRERLRDSVEGLHLERGIMAVPALSAKHWRLFQEAKAGPFVRAVLALQDDPAWRAEMDEVVGEYLHDNVVHHEYLLTRAIKVGPGRLALTARRFTPFSNTTPVGYDRLTASMGMKGTRCHFYTRERSLW